MWYPRVEKEKEKTSEEKKNHGERRNPGGGPGAETVDGEEECPGGNARVRWRPADAEACAGRRGGADSTPRPNRLGEPNTAELQNRLHRLVPVKSTTPS